MRADHLRIGDQVEDAPQPRDDRGQRGELRELDRGAERVTRGGPHRHRAVRARDLDRPGVAVTRHHLDPVEMARIANYAARVAEGVAKGPDDDLGLFSADGTPTENLVKVMANMAAVEIGPLRASDALVNLAVAQLRLPSQSDAASR